jgi:hypothetical protein
MPHSHGHGGHSHGGHGHSHGGGGMADKADFWTWFGSLDEFYNGLVGTTVWIAPTADFIFTKTRQVLDIASPKAFIVSGISSLLPALGAAYCHRLLYKRFQKAPDVPCSETPSPIHHVAQDIEEEKPGNNEFQALQDNLLTALSEADEQQDDVEIINKKEYLAFNWREYTMITGDVFTHVGEGAQNVILAGNIISKVAMGEMPLGMNIGLQVLAAGYGLVRSYPEARNCYNVIREFKNFELQNKLTAGTAILDNPEIIITPEQPAVTETLSIMPTGIQANNTLPQKADAWTWFGAGDEFFDSLLGNTVWLAPGIDLFIRNDDKILGIGSPMAFMAAGLTGLLAAPGAAYCHRLLFKRFQAVKNSPKASNDDVAAEEKTAAESPPEDTSYLNFSLSEYLLIGGDIFTHVGEGAQNIILGVNIVAALCLYDMSFEARLVLQILATIYGLARSIPEARNCVTVLREYKKFEHELKVAEAPIAVINSEATAKKSGLLSWCCTFGSTSKTSAVDSPALTPDPLLPLREVFSEQRENKARM